MAGRSSRLTPEQWQDLIKYYYDGHTLEECGRIWGYRGDYLSKKLKKMGVKLRAPFEPSRPEKWEKAPPHTQIEFAQIVEQEPPAPEAPSQSVEDRQPRRALTARRKIISVSENAEMLYEKEY